MNKSEHINELAIALSEFQGEIKDVEKDTQGHGYKYANLSQILEVSRPLVQKYGLAVSQLCGSADEKVSVETLLMHKSGQWISSIIEMKVERSLTKEGKFKMSLAQEVGCVITYARRYGIAAILGITQVDNDAQVERGHNYSNNNKQQAKVVSILPVQAQVITEDTYTMLISKFSEREISQDTINQQLSKRGLNSLTQLTDNQGKSWLASLNKKEQENGK
jgi:ERF superfamily